MTKHHRELILSSVQHRAYKTRKDIIELSHLVEEALQQEMARRTEMANEEIGAAEDEAERVFLEANHEDLIEQVTVTFSRLQRYALFTTAMSTTERNFVLLCRAAKALLPLGSEFDDRKPGVIQRTIEYLEKQVGISTIRFKNYILLAQNLVSIRNCIVHSDGRITERKDAIKIRDFIQEIPTIEASDGEMIMLLPGFVENMTHSMHLLFDRLFQSLKEKAQPAAARGGA